MFRKLRYFFILKVIKHLTPYLYLRLKYLSKIGLLHISEWQKDDFKRKIIHYRPSIKFIKKYFENKNLIGVEIGVYKGTNALYIQKELNIKKLYLIDIWQNFKTFNKYRNNSKEFKTVLNLFKDNKKVEIIRDFSLNACKLFKDNSLDFGYIDANHQYDYIYNDIKNWYNKIKIKGILCGHDIQINDVLIALVQYCSENKIKYFIDPPDWYIIKEKEKNKRILTSYY